MCTSGLGSKCVSFRRNYSTPGLPSSAKKVELFPRFAVRFCRRNHRCLKRRTAASAEALDAASRSDTPSTLHILPSKLPIPLQRVWDESGDPSIRYCHKSLISVDTMYDLRLAQPNIKNTAREAKRADFCPCICNLFSTCDTPGIPSESHPEGEPCSMCTIYAVNHVHLHRALARLVLIFLPRVRYL